MGSRIFFVALNFGPLEPCMEESMSFANWKPCLEVKFARDPALSQPGQGKLSFQHNLLKIVEGRIKSHPLISESSAFKLLWKSLMTNILGHVRHNISFHFVSFDFKIFLIYRKFQTCKSRKA